MGKWTISVDDSKMSKLRNYGECYTHGGGAGGYFDFFGDSLQEAADNLIHIFADVFSDDGTTVIEYPEHVIIDEKYTSTQTVPKNISHLLYLVNAKGIKPVLAISTSTPISVSIFKSRRCK